MLLVSLSMFIAIVLLSNPIFAFGIFNVSFGLINAPLGVCQCPHPLFHSSVSAVKHVLSGH